MHRARAVVPHRPCRSCGRSSTRRSTAAAQGEGGEHQGRQPPRKSWQLLVNVKESVENSFRCEGNKWLPG